MLQGSSFDLGFCVAAWQDRGRNGDALMKRLFLAGIICVVDASAFWEMYNSGSFSMAAVVPSRWNHLESINHHSISWNILNLNQIKSVSNKFPGFISRIFRDVWLRLAQPLIRNDSRPNLKSPCFSAITPSLHQPRNNLFWLIVYLYSFISFYTIIYLYIYIHI